MLHGIGIVVQSRPSAKRSRRLGVVFIDENDGGPGVRLAKPLRQKRS